MECVCYHDFCLEPDGPDGLSVRLPVSGNRHLLTRVLRSSGLAERLSFEVTNAPGTDGATRPKEGSGIVLNLSGYVRVAYTLSGVSDKVALQDFLSLLRHRIIIDLPKLDECYALGPYSLVSEGQWENAKFGELVRKAKHDMNIGAKAALTDEAIRFVRSHPMLRSVAAVTSPPRSESTRHNIPGEIAQALAEALGVPLVEIRKDVPTEPQKNRDKDEGEEAMAAHVSKTMCVDGSIKGAVLVIDDALRSGGTMKEAARALRAASAEGVYGLCAAKNAQFTDGRIRLAKEHWQ